MSLLELEPKKMHSCKGSTNVTSKIRVLVVKKTNSTGNCEVKCITCHYNSCSTDTGLGFQFVWVRKVYYLQKHGQRLFGCMTSLQLGKDC